MRALLAIVVVAALVSGLNLATPAREPTEEVSTPGKGYPDGGIVPTPVPDSRTNGAWMVYVLGEDFTGGPRYSVSCWINSDASTFRDVEIDRATYERYLENGDTGSIPCPG